MLKVQLVHTSLAFFYIDPLIFIVVGGLYV
jgi:hypothetical protein